MNPEQVSIINKVQAEAVFGPTVYVMVDLDGKKHKELVDTGSNVNFLSEKAYSQYEQCSKLRPFGNQWSFRNTWRFYWQSNVRHRG